MKYFACIIIRDGEKTIAKCISSILNQTIKPIKIVVVNDGSTDRTGTIIDKYKDEHPSLIDVINTGNQTRDYTRLPKLRTMAIEHAQANGCRDCKYFMTTGGDCNFEERYAEKILAEMERDPKLVIASGDYGKIKQVTPHGAGRFIRTSFFDHYRKNYPLRVCQESELSTRAICSGYRIAVVRATYEHLEKLGHSHNFRGWGRNMKLLGYSRLHVLARFTGDFFSDDVGKRAAIRMLWRYFTYKPDKEGYFSCCEPELRKSISKLQRHLVKRAVIRRAKGYAIKALLPRRKKKTLLLPAKFNERFRRSGVEGDLAYVELDNGLRLYGYKSRKYIAKFYPFMADLLSPALTEETYGCAIDVAMRYIRELPYPKHLLPQRGGTVAEIGAYLGHKSIKFSELVGPEGKVLAVEMMPDNFAILERNIRENNLTNVTIKHLGAWNERQMRQVLGESQQRNSLVSIDERAMFVQRGTVQTDTLDNILRDWDVPQIDFLNIRVNGAEIEVLEGLNTQLNRVKIIFVASHYSRGGQQAVIKVKELLKQKECKIVLERGTSIYAVTKQYAESVLQ